MSSQTNKKTLLFVIVLCFCAALVLSLVASGLRTPQEEARTLYKSKQLLRAAAILNEEQVFILGDSYAIYDPEKKVLVPSRKKEKAKPQAILEVFKARLLTRLTNDQGDLFTFEEANLNETNYLIENEKTGYASLPYKLVYIVLPNGSSKEALPYGYIIPVNGYGLWDAIYGYLGLESNANTVLGMTWYSQKETPGLGGEIALPQWQNQFKGKQIFQKSSSEAVDFESTPLGIRVVKTTVRATYGDSPFAASAVDGIPGASITVLGVNEALRDSLNPYRTFLIRAHERGAQK